MWKRDDVDGGGFLEEGEFGGGGAGTDDEEGGLKVMVEDETVGEFEEGDEMTHSGAD